VGLGPSAYSGHGLEARLFKDATLELRRQGRKVEPHSDALCLSFKWDAPERSVLIWERTTDRRGWSRTALGFIGDLRIWRHAMIGGRVRLVACCLAPSPAARPGPAAAGRGPFVPALAARGPRARGAGGVCAGEQTAFS